MTKEIPVVNKSRKQIVPVHIESTKQDEVPLPPEDYMVQDGDLDADNKLDLVNELANLSPREVREVVRIAKHLRKVNSYFKRQEEFADFDMEEN